MHLDWILLSDYDCIQANCDDLSARLMAYVRCIIWCTCEQWVPIGSERCHWVPKNSDGCQWVPIRQCLVFHRISCRINAYPPPAISMSYHGIILNECKQFTRLLQDENIINYVILIYYHTSWLIPFIYL